MDKKQIVITTCEASTIQPLRARILRPGQPFESSIYPGDEKPTTLHLAALLDDQVIGCATWMPEAAKFAEAQNPYRLRGMAADTKFQGIGIGKKLIEKSFRILRERNADLLWCNAREIAFPFYEKMGFEYFGEMFEIPLIGPHKIMFIRCQALFRNRQETADSGKVPGT